MISRRQVMLFGLAAAVAFAAPVARVWADAPATQAAGTLRAFYSTLSATMKNGPSLGFSGRRDRLEVAVKSAFDLPRMTRLAVGPRWQALSPQQQSELVTAFGDYSAATYASRFTHDAGEHFEVSSDVTATDDGAIVHTKLMRSNEAPVQLDYLMKQDGGSWKIEDVYLSGTISELATRRSEFTAVLDRGGPQALVDALRKKAAGENG
jgi:phospholipid transport system substrate-binding protein